MVEGADLPLFGRGALVTGAGRGIGRAIAQRLAALGATVLCVSRTQSELDETVRSAGSRAFALALDISAGGAAGLEGRSRPGPLRELQYHPRREHGRSRNARRGAGRLDGVRRQSPG